MLLSMNCVGLSSADQTWIPSFSSFSAVWYYHVISVKFGCQWTRVACKVPFVFMLTACQRPTQVLSTPLKLMFRSYHASSSVYVSGYSAAFANSPPTMSHNTPPMWSWRWPDHSHCRRTQLLPSSASKFRWCDHHQRPTFLVYILSFPLSPPAAKHLRKHLGAAPPCPLPAFLVSTTALAVTQPPLRRVHCDQHNNTPEKVLLVMVASMS